MVGTLLSAPDQYNGFQMLNLVPREGPMCCLAGNLEISSDVSDQFVDT